MSTILVSSFEESGGSEDRGYVDDVASSSSMDSSILGSTEQEEGSEDETTIVNRNKVIPQGVKEVTVETKIDAMKV